MLRVVTLPKEHADIDALAFQGVDEVHQIGLDPTAGAVFPVVVISATFIWISP